MFGFFKKKAAKPSVSLKDCDKQAPPIAQSAPEDASLPPQEPKGWLSNGGSPIEGH